MNTFVRDIDFSSLQQAAGKIKQAAADLQQAAGKIKLASEYLQQPLGKVKPCAAGLLSLIPDLCKRYNIIRQLQPGCNIHPKIF